MKLFSNKQEKSSNKNSKKLMRLIKEEKCLLKSKWEVKRNSNLMRTVLTNLKILIRRSRLVL